ncbi:MAG: class I SAM-dependent methyltransferase [Rhizomicrobium sp.]
MSEWLEKVYRVAEPYGTPMDEAGLGRQYAEDFLAYILRSLGRKDLKCLRIVEIGCGYGYLLKRMLELGADATGIEPGPGGKRAQEAGLPVINEPFDAAVLEEPIDIFVEYGVLEHIASYSDFIKAQRSRLASNGKIIISVPDCGWCVEAGDASMLVHEHWNYFTESSLSVLAAKENFSPTHCVKGGVGGTLYATWQKTDSAVASAAIAQAGNHFQSNFDALSHSIKFLLENWDAEGLSIGVYVPGRILNYLPLIETGVRLRFFDDDPNLTGKYYPPFDFPIENRANLITNPVDRLLIMSTSFGPQIAETLTREKVLASAQIVTLKDIQEASAR